MARLPVVVFVSTETALALSLPLAFVLAFPSCAPASLSCLVDGRCLQLCADAWSQFPAILGVGAVLGLVPATLGYAATRGHLRPRPGAGARATQTVLSGGRNPRAWTWRPSWRRTSPSRNAPSKRSRSPRRSRRTSA